MKGNRNDIKIKELAAAWTQVEAGWWSTLKIDSKMAEMLHGPENTKQEKQGGVGDRWLRVALKTTFCGVR